MNIIERDGSVAHDVLQIRSRISDALLLALAVFSIPALIGSLNRINTIGWQPVMAVHIVVVTLLWLTVIFRKHIQYQFRASFIIAIFLIIGFSGLIQFGLIAGSIALIVTAAPMTTLLLGINAAIVVFILSMLGIIAIGYAMVSGYIELGFDLNVYHTAFSSWLNIATGLFFISASITTSIAVFNHYLITAIRRSREREEDLHQHQASLEKIIEEKTNDLKRSNQELERFAQIAAHDIKSPLTHISGHTQLLKATSQDKLDQRSVRFIDEIIQSCEYISTIINDQLATSRINKKQDIVSELDMNLVIVNAIHQLTYEINSTGANIHYDELPVVRGIASQITRVFQNLISNAIKYRDKNRDIHINISASQNNQVWVFKIEDNGIGIEKNELQKIFEIYHQSETDQKKPGLGIGLSSCKKIIEQHGGNIWVESSPGEGSHFYFTLKSIDFND